MILLSPDTQRVYVKNVQDDLDLPIGLLVNYLDYDSCNYKVICSVPSRGVLHINPLNLTHVDSFIEDYNQFPVGQCEQNLHWDESRQVSVSGFSIARQDISKEEFEYLYLGDWDYQGIEEFHKKEAENILQTQTRTTDLINNITQWHHDRNLIEGSTDKDQYMKLIQECGELSDNICKGRDISDDIGDIIVVLINIAERNNLSIQHCLEQAWNDIKDRKGKMVEGIFIKEGDL